MIFNKFFKNNDYELFFSTATGVEVLRGTTGKEDPFSLYLPSLIDVGIMGHCKNKCKFCYQGHINEPNMSFDNFKIIIDQTKHHTNQVALGGRGDPNQHEEFEKIVTYAKDNGVTPNYTTSGIGLTDKHIEISKVCGAVAISNYCKEYTYNAIEKLLNAGVKTNIHTIFSKESYNMAVQILSGENPWQEGESSLVDIDKLNAVIFLLFKPAGAGVNLDWVPEPHQLKKFSEVVFKPQSKFKIGMDSCLVNHVLKYVTPNKLQQMSIDSCEAARMSAYITPDMRLMPCSFADKNLWSVPITNDHDIEYIWNNTSPFQLFRESLNNNRYSCPLGL